MWTFLIYLVGKSLKFKAIFTSNVIESFNYKLKREIKKRIIFKAEDGKIIITDIRKSYNKSAGLRILTYLGEATGKEKEALGFNI